MPQLKRSEGVKASYVATQFQGAIFDRINGARVWTCEHTHTDALDATRCAASELDTRHKEMETLCDFPTKVKIPLI